MKAVLVSAFPTAFVEMSILPALRRRVTVLDYIQPDAAEHFDFAAASPDVVLHMTEYGGHSASAGLSRACRAAGITLRSLSRKKAAWSFLPPPSGEEPEDEEVEEQQAAEEVDVTALEARAVGRDLKSARETAGLTQKELAERLSVVQPLVSRMETGQKVPDQEWCGRVLEACRLPPTWRGLVKQKEKVMSAAVSLGLPESEANDLILRLRNENGELRSQNGLLNEKLEACQADATAMSRLIGVAHAISTLQEVGIMSREDAREKALQAILVLLGGTFPGKIG